MNCQRHARSPEFAIADDSTDVEAVDGTKAALARLANQFNARIRYADREGKRRFAAALAAESAVSPDIIRFAFFGDERCAWSTGANRNTLLLDAAGTLVLAVDDDTLCRIAEAPERQSELSFFSGYDPSEFWFFQDRKHATQAVSFVDADVLGCHEGLLGSDVTALGGPAGTGGSVTMTLHGLVGDSGMASPRYYRTLTGASRDRLVASAQAYRSALKSREVLRCVRQPTITPGPFCMTTFLGLDNRLPLPPFFPVQRNSDGIFGLTLQKCLDGSHVAFLPWILLHAPEPPREFAPNDLWTDAATVRMADIVIAAVLAHQAPAGHVTTETRLAALGKHLRWLGSMNLPDFEAHVHAAQRFRNFGLITALHGQLQAYGESPGFWAEDVKRTIDVLSKASTEEDHLVPRDLLHRHHTGAARQLSQELVGKFGEVLEAWPEMVAAAKRLRARGCRLTAAL